MESRQQSVELCQPNEQLEVAKTVRIMRAMHAQEIFETPVQSKEFLDNLSFGEFIRWTALINGVETGIPIHEREIGSNSYIESYSNVSKSSHCRYLPPHSEYRIILLQKAFKKAQSIKDPKVAGLTLSFAMNAIHPYDDGNGRTGRVIYSLLSRGYSGSDDDNQYYSEMLENFNGRKMINPNSLAAGLDQVVTNELYDKIRNDSGYGNLIPITHISSAYRYPDDKWAELGDEVAENLAISKDLSNEDRQALHYVLQDKNFAIIPIFKTFSPDRIAPFMAKRLPEYDDGTTYIDGKRFALSLSSEDINNLFEEAISLKNEFIEKIINFSDRPDAEKYINMFA